MRLLKRTIYLAFILVLTTTGTRSISIAKADQSCSFDGDIKALADAEANQSTDYLTSLQNEVKIRRNILKKICDCGLTDTQNLEASLKKVTVSDPDIRDTQSQLVSQMEQIKSRYSSEKLRIDELGLYGTKEFAKNLEDWRVMSQNETISRATNFVLWATNQSLIGTASTRFQKISQTVQVLGLSDKEDIKGFFHQASDFLNDAKNKNNDAATLLKNNDTSPNTLEIIKGSLSSLAGVYQAFFDLSESIQKILPQ